MVNTDDFIKRIEIILDYYSLNASAFADKIGVQRSSLSHLLSGRNKPSLDFILKILDVFPEVDLYWLLNGKGSFPKNDDTLKMEETNISSQTKSPVLSRDLFSEELQENDTEIKENINPLKTQNTLEEHFSGDIEKIVFFYKNGTFKVFNPK